MRTVPTVALTLAAIVVSGCITFSGEPTPSASAAPTEIPMITPEPTSPPTQPPTAGPPTPTPDPNATPTATALNLVPYLTAEVTAINLAAQPVTVTITLVDPDSAEEYQVGTFHLAPEQVTSQLIVPTRFRLDFEIDGTEVATCTIDIADGEQLQFAVIETGAVMTSNGPQPEDPADLVVATSSRCQAGSAP
jgi:hypothetical protein